MDVRKAAADPAYVREKKRVLEKYGLKCWALGAHLAGQCVGDEYDARLDGFAPDAVKGKPEALRKWADRRDEGRGPRGPQHGLLCRQRLHGLAHLEGLVLLPHDDRGDGRGRLPEDPRPLDAHPRRVRRAGRQVRPRGPSDRDRLRPLHDPAPARCVQLPPDARPQFRSEPPRLAGRSSRTSSSASSPTASTTST